MENLNPLSSRSCSTTQLWMKQLSLRVKRDQLIRRCNSGLTLKILNLKSSFGLDCWVQSNPEMETLLLLLKPPTSSDISFFTLIPLTPPTQLQDGQALNLDSFKVRLCLFYLTLFYTWRTILKRKKESSVWLSFCPMRATWKEEKNVWRHSLMLLFSNKHTRLKSARKELLIICLNFCREKKILSKSNNYAWLSLPIYAMVARRIRNYSERSME